MSNGFYRAFEEKYRGSRELIKSRLRAYLPFIKPLAELDEGAQTIDLGCGRGEWLELMTEVGFKPHGVDLDEGMLSGCVELGLSVNKVDAIKFLAALPSESQAIVSAFHFVEHISFEQLQTVVSEALRVLKPGGLLIMETPNPENIVVSTCNFYLDPTHQRPIPPQLLSFLPEYLGFARVKTIRLQESNHLVRNASLTLYDVLGGVSPDYAVIAQKTASADILQKTDPPFGDEYGLSLAKLATKYTVQIETKAQQTQMQAQQAEAKIQQAEAKIQQAEAKVQQAETALQAIYLSRSWRLTRPLREISLTRNWLKNKGYELTKISKKLIILWFLKPLVKIIYIPVIITKVKKWSMRHPGIHMKLIELRNRIISSDSLNEIAVNMSKNDMTAHVLMQLVGSKLENNEKLSNVLYLTESGEHE